MYGEKMKCLQGGKTPSKHKMQLRNGLFIIVSALSINTFAAVSSNRANSEKDANESQKQYSWSGFYAGGVLGALWSQNNTTWNPLPSPIAFSANQITGNNNSSDFVGGVISGYNYQFTRSFVSGVEADWSWTNARGSSISAPWINGNQIIEPSSYTNMKSTLNWIPSIRGRLGYLVLPKIMVYGAVGVAWANLNYAANKILTA